MNSVVPEVLSNPIVFDTARVFAESAFALAMAARITIPKETLRLLSGVFQLPTREIGALLHVSPEIVRRELHRHELPVLSRGRPPALTEGEVQALATIYHDDELQSSLETVAALAPDKIVDGSHLGKIFERMGIKKRPRGRPKRVE